MRSESILVVDDERLIRWSLRKELEKLGFPVFEAESLQSARSVMLEADIDLVLLDQMLPDGSGVDLIGQLREKKSETAVVMLTAVDKWEVAVQAMKLGAFDYLVKPADPTQLMLVVEKALEHTRMKRQMAYLIKQGEARFGIANLIGSSPVMMELKQKIGKIAQSGSTTVLITGESGTGKDLVAHGIHSLSSRRDRPFMAVNCSALAETLIETELFGHEKGAFTDARAQRKGLFEIANTGTVFLDEIGDMSPAIQVKLLRILEDQSFRRIGGSTDIRVDVRIIAATNQSLEDLMRAGKFRSDLYFRLNVVQIRMPSVRERGDDIVLLAEYFLQHFNAKFGKSFRGLAPETKNAFLAHVWPGNVREMKNVIERAVLLDDGEYLPPDHIGFFEAMDRPAAEAPIELPPSLADVEKNSIVHALAQSGNNQSQAARLLRISRDTLRYKMKKYGLL